MKRIWNTFCEDISKNKGVMEMTFEKEIVKGFLQALRWSRYDGNLEEQYGMCSRKWIPDFVLYLNNDKKQNLANTMQHGLKWAPQGALNLSDKIYDELR